MLHSVLKSISSADTGNFRWTLIQLLHLAQNRPIPHTRRRELYKQLPIRAPIFRLLLVELHENFNAWSDYFVQHCEEEVKLFFVKP